MAVSGDAAILTSCTCAIFNIPSRILGLRRLLFRTCGASTCSGELFSSEKRETKLKVSREDIWRSRRQKRVKYFIYVTLRCTPALSLFLLTPRLFFFSLTSGNFYSLFCSWSHRDSYPRVEERDRRDRGWYTTRLTLLPLLSLQV